MKRKDLSLNTRIVCALVASMVSIAAVGARPGAKAPASRPTLVVGIFVEGLTAEYVDLLRSNFTEGGFIAPMALAACPEEKKPSACVGCRSCEAVCPQQIKISEVMKDFTEKLKA